MKNSLKAAAEQAADTAERLFREANGLPRGPTREKLIDQATAALSAAAHAVAAIRDPRVVKRKSAGKGKAAR